MKVSDDLHLLGQKFEHIPLKQEIADGSDDIEVELRAEVVENVSSGGSVFAVPTE